MEQILLTKDERDNVANSVDESLYETSIDYWDAIIEAENKAQLKKVVGWATGWCEHRETALHRKHCFKCWQTLQKEAEE